MTQSAPQRTGWVGPSSRSDDGSGADRSDRGQVGVGTLVVFIALVLVAAIAAGVLINTAGFLQTQAENTGSESTKQVAENLNVITTVGEVNGSQRAIDTVRIGVQPASGADNLNLEEVTVQYVSDDSFGNLVHVTAATPAGQGTVFNTEPITAEDGSDNVMTGASDRYEIVIPLNESQPFFERDADIDSTDVEANEFAVVQEEGDTFGASDEGVRFVDVVNGTELEGFTEAITDSGDDGFTEEFLSVLGNAGDLDTLDEGEEAELTFTTDTAAQTRAILQVPESLAGEDDDSTIDL